MKISLDWLQTHIDLSALSVAKLAEVLTMTGIEVEGIDRSAVIPDGVVAAKILERNKHPNAEKLSVCQVFDGEKTVQIVCGAPNCDAGKIVPLATLGTVLSSPDGSEFAIKPAKLRGEESFGMMCSARELGLGTEHGGLLELPDSVQPGTLVKTLFPSDTIFELEVTGNRPDWLSHWGVARDLSAALEIPAEFPKICVPKVSAADASLVTVKDSISCPRYVARVVRGVTVKESPEWLKKRLESIGLRPINNIVDITNFVLHELGQPLHAFDLNKLSGKRIVVRRAVENEPFVTLDGKSVKLHPNHLVIADAVKPVAIAGVMGGLDSGVTETTTDILIEGAYFLPSSIRATSKDLGISSDSSYRYERGCDYDMAFTGSALALQLVLELAGGTAEVMLDVAGVPPERVPFEMRFDRVNALLGTDLSAADMIGILERLGTRVTNVKAESCTVQAPSWRHDLSRMADAAEEIIRIHGLDKLPLKASRAVQGGILADDKLHTLQTARDQLISLGLYECYSYSMVEEKTAKLDPSFTEDEVIAIANPLNLDMACLRPSLFAQMLQNIGRNVSRNNLHLRLFELGRVFCANPKHFPEERQEIVIALTGLRMPKMFASDRAAVTDFADLKGVVEAFLSLRKLSGECRAAVDKRFVTGRCAEVIVRGKTIGVIGEVAPHYTRSLRLRHPLFMGILQLAPLLINAAGIPQLAPLSPFPPTERDIAFIAPEHLTHQEVVRFIRKLNLPNLENIQLFDVFRDPKTVGEGMKSLAYSLTFRNSERTLTDDEVNKAAELARSSLAEGLQVILR